MAVSFDNIFKEKSEHLKKISSAAGEINWQCPSNIALVKYWGKKNYQLPMNPSVSMTLNDCYTKLSVKYEISGKDQAFTLQYRMNNTYDENVTARIIRYLKSVSVYLPFLSGIKLEINSVNNFPHATGIASSASAFGALSLALCSIEHDLFGTLSDKNEFLQKASFLARLGSGSASRSVFGGFVCWGETGMLSNSSNEIAVPVNDIHSIYKDLYDSILVVDSSEKAVSSSDGHKFMDDHMYAKQRYIQAGHHTSELINYLKDGNIYDFMELTEKEAQTLHALMMTSSAPYILIRPDTLEIMSRITQFRKKNRVPVGYTLDAGPNVHVLYPGVVADEVQDLINNELISYCEDKKIIYDGVGEGPQND